MYGERIKELRTEKGWSQAKLGEILNCSQRLVSKYELEQVDLGTEVLINLCKTFHVSADYILGLEDEAGAKLY